MIYIVLELEWIEIRVILAPMHDLFEPSTFPQVGLRELCIIFVAPISFLLMTANHDMTLLFEVVACLFEVFHYYM